MALQVEEAVVGLAVCTIGAIGLRRFGIMVDEADPMKRPPITTVSWFGKLRFAMNLVGLVWLLVLVAVLIGVASEEGPLAGIGLGAVYYFGSTAFEALLDKLDPQYESTFASLVGPLALLIIPLVGWWLISGL